MLIPLVGYAPDVDPTTPGILTNCANLIPTLKGMAGAASPQSSTIPALAAACVGAAVLEKLDSTRRFFAGTTTALYEAGASSWTDRTRASGGAYALGTDVRWRFAQFGNVSLAAAKSDTLQSSTSGAFANVTGAPKAAIVETVNQFVLLFDTNEATYGDSPDRWWCSALGDHTDWTPAIATQSATGRLLSSAGRIRAARRFGESVIVYKDKTMFIGAYVGPPVIWSFQEIPGTTGAPCQEAVVNVGTVEDPRHIFMGFDDFYSFDGSRPVPIGSPIKETVFGELNKSFSYAVWTLHDRINSLVYFYYPVGSSINPDKCVVYNYRSNRWGRDDRQVEAAIEFTTLGITYDDLGTLYSTYNDFPNLSYDSSFWTAGFPVPAIFNISHRIQTLDGASTSSSLTTGDYGDENGRSLLQRVTPRFITAPASATMTNYYRNKNSGDTLQTGSTVTLSENRFDTLQSAHWHRVKMDFTGDVELSGLVPNTIPDGSE